MDEYAGFWVDLRGSGIECWKGTGYEYHDGFGDGYGDGYGDGGETEHGYSSLPLNYVEG